MLEGFIAADSGSPEGTLHIRLDVLGSVVHHVVESHLGELATDEDLSKVGNLMKDFFHFIRSLRADVIEDLVSPFLRLPRQVICDCL